jgi:hypothetical protein
MRDALRVGLAVGALWLPCGLGASDDCTLEDIRYYERTFETGECGAVDVATIYCAGFLIRNTSGGGRFDAMIEATLTDGSSSRVQVKTPRLQSGETHPGDLCFGSVRIRQLACSWR